MFVKIKTGYEEVSAIQNQLDTNRRNLRAPNTITHIIQYKGREDWESQLALLGLNGNGSNSSRSLAEYIRLENVMVPGSLPMVVVRTTNKKLKDFLKERGFKSLTRDGQLEEITKSSSDTL